jgi:mono/diheme cytochrome c family protein
MPRRVAAILVTLFVLSLVPFACIFRARATLSPRPRIHVVQGMDNQPRYKGQMVNPAFADTRSDRPWPLGTIARGHLADDPALTTGHVGEAWVPTFPMKVDAALLARGRERFGIYCAPCHGLSGYGDGTVARRADRIAEGTWVPPSSLHDAGVRGRPVGHVFNTITNGIRTMPSYAAQIDVLDRWAIVAYVRALQRSQHGSPGDLPPDQLAGLR